MYFKANLQVNDNEDTFEGKIQYLIQASIPNLKAHQLIDSMRITRKEFENLQKKIERKDLLRGSVAKTNAQKCVES